MKDNKIIILLVEDNKEFARLVEFYLNKYENDKFEIIWKENGPSAIEEFEKNKDIDIVLMDYHLPGKNGAEVAKLLLEKGINVPIIFLTVNRDFELAVQVMQLRVKDYIVKEDITSPILPRTIIGVLEKYKLQNQILDLEIKQHRLEALQAFVSDVVKNISSPLNNIGNNIKSLKVLENIEQAKVYLKIIEDNYKRILGIFDKLKTLERDDTTTYIKEIKMIDLS